MAAPPSEPAAAAPSKKNPQGTSLGRVEKKLVRLVAARAKDAAKHADPDALFADGEAIKAALSDIVPGQDVLVAAGRRIPLDARLSAVDNMHRTFHAAKRARRGRQVIATKRAEAEALLAAVQRLRQRLREAEAGAEDATLDDDVAAFIAARQSARRQGAGGKKAQAARVCYRRFGRPDQVPILVGRSARDNDTLTFRIGKGKDTWLHAKGVAGSHVIVRATLEAIGQDRLLDAAHLAVHFSKHRGQTHADVAYTARKNIRKAGKGAPAGLVLVSSERILHLVVDEERLGALLASEVSPGANRG